MRTSLVFGPDGARLVIEPEGRADKRLLDAYGISLRDVVATVDTGKSPFDLHGEDSVGVVRVTFSSKPPVAA